MSLPDYLKDTAKDFAKQLTASTSVPIKTSTFTGRQFVAGEDPLQTQAINLARQGVGSFQPFLQAAQTAVGATSRTDWTDCVQTVYVTFSTRCHRYNTSRF